MKRTDIHRPSAIIPTEYDFVAFQGMKIEGIEDCHAVLEERRLLTAHMDRTGGKFSDHEHGGNCHICGASFTYGVVFYHANSNSYIKTGHDCAHKLGLGFGDFDGFKTSLRDAHELKAGKRKAEAVLTEAGLAAAWTLHSVTLPALRDAAQDDFDCTGDQYDKPWCSPDQLKVMDIVGKLVKYGSLSEKQLDFLRLLMDRITRQPEIDAERAAEKEAAAPCPKGRTTVTGTILSTKVQESDFGSVIKMLVKADEGYMVWVSVPSSIEANARLRVRFTATLTPSETDPKFGYGKRPSNATTGVEGSL